MDRRSRVNVGRRTAEAGEAHRTGCRLPGADAASSAQVSHPALSGPKLVELCYPDAKLAVFLARLLAGYAYAETGKSGSGA